LQRLSVRGGGGGGGGGGGVSTGTSVDPDGLAQRQRKRFKQQQMRPATRDRARQEEESQGFEDGYGPQNLTDHRIKWGFWIKGDVGKYHSYFRRYMREHIHEHFKNLNMMHFNEVDNWYRRLTVQFQPRMVNLSDQGGLVFPLTRVLCNLYVPAEQAYPVFMHLTEQYYTSNYTRALQYILGVNGVEEEDAILATNPFTRMGVVGTTSVAETNEEPNPNPFPNLDAAGYNRWPSWLRNALP
jgi:hypothetical protein